MNASDEALEELRSVYRLIDLIEDARDRDQLFDPFEAWECVQEAKAVLDAVPPPVDPGRPPGSWSEAQWEAVERELSALVWKLAELVGRLDRGDVESQLIASCARNAREALQPVYDHRVCD